MKRAVAEYVAICDTCQHVKEEHQRPTGEKQVFGPDIIQDAEQQLRIVQENLRVAQSRQRSYADVHRRDLSFKVDDHVYLKLKKCLRVPEEQAPQEGLEVQEDLTYTEHPVKILDTLERSTRNKRIKMCRVQWSHHTEAEATWEREDELKAAYPALFAN
ncbi:hypothetical protein U9M48_036086 [Paspalum notatum var. saurae]|uniref:Chromo domain-containing protein n=1 Tax=Paspalum notatum var. saurae TaxID=547442 RepID=A0AAQ3UGH9_PASNO